MKTLTKFFGIIAIGAVIAAGLSACGTLFTPAPEPDAETLALRDTLRSTTWEKRALPSQPSLSGLEKLASGSEEFRFFQSSASSDSESDEGREIKGSLNGVAYTIRLMYMAKNTWYELRSPDLPGITYYYFKSGSASSAVSVINVYKRS